MLSRILLVITMVCLATAAVAEEKPKDTTAPDPVAPEKPEAVRRLDEANELARSGKAAAAMPIWAEVLPQLPDDLRPAVHLDLGMACKKYGKLPEAWHHLTAYAKLAPKPDAKGKEALEQVDAALTRGFARVKVVSRPAGATVYFGDSQSGTGHPCPLIWWFKPGQHKITLALAGHENATVEIKAGLPGSEKLESFQLFADEREGELHVKGPEVGAKVFVNGQEKGTVPLTVKLKPGTHQLMVSRPGRPAWKREVIMPPGGKVTKRPRLPRMMGDHSSGGSLLPTMTDSNSGRKKTSATHAAIATREAMEGKVSLWKWSLVGGGGAMIVVGGILQIVGYRRNEDLHTSYPDGTLGSKAPAEYPLLYKQGYDNDVKPLATTAYALYSLGAAAAITGGILLLLEDSPDRGIASSRGWLAPTVVPGGAGISCGFGF
jgi:hypothetical protein